MTRMDETADSTVSSLWALSPTDDSVREAFLGFVIEDGPRPEKVPGETRIPKGIYRLRQRTYGKFYDRYNATYGHKWVPELVAIPNYSDVLIHIGNEVSDTRGCLLVNDTVTFDHMRQVYSGSGSASAYKRLYNYLYSRWSRDDVQIEIRR